MEVLLWTVVVILVLVGFAGVIFPVLPGTPFVFLGLLLAGYIDGFHRVGWPTYILLGVLVLLSLAADFFATSVGAKRAGASGKALSGAALGTLVGIFFGLPGLLLGPFVGAALGEYAARRSLLQAGRAGVGTWLGILLGVALKIAVVFGMIGVFAFAYFL
jgi:uncharacterized protein YqgC (DUF456 family)